MLAGEVATQKDADGQDSLPRTSTLAQPHATSMFSSVHTLLKLICTLPVTTCTSERSHDGLKRVKPALLHGEQATCRDLHGAHAS